jgi:hypothetical protein
LKVIHRNSHGAWDLAAYFAYLETVRARLAPHVVAFALAVERYLLDSRHSLHDAWLESLAVEEPATGVRSERRIRGSISVCSAGITIAGTS